MNFRAIAISTASLFALAAAAQANNQISTLPQHTEVRSEVNVSLMGEQLNQPLAAALEKRVISKPFNKKIEKELGVSGQKILRRGYAQRVFKPIWTEAGAQSLLDALNGLDEHGLVSSDDDMIRLKTIIEKRFDNARTPRSRAKADTKLSIAFLRKAKILAGGLSDEGGADTPDLDGPMRSNLTDALLKAGQGQAVYELDALTPQGGQYGALQNALDKYRALKAAGGWLAIPDGDVVEVGESDPRIPAIKNRLEAEGFYTPIRSYFSTTAPDVFTHELEAALKTFQSRHGLEDDGVVGNNTLFAMNESVESKIDKIADSMHRWRVQGDMGKRHIWANIPSYKAIGMRDGVREIEMRTIVGKPRYATQTFSDQVEYMVANPKWFLPVSITRRQKVPKLQRDPGYAQKYGYNIFDRKTGEAVEAANVDWSEPGVASKYRFVQDAGPGNALGKLKIIFPNQYSIYLHGTPSKKLFDKAQRAFSSGCVRLEDPVAMAEWIAKGDSNLTPERVTNASESGENTRLELDEHIPVHITYFLVTANEDGSVNFLRDIYERDDGIETVEKMADLYIPKLATNQTSIEGAP